MQPLSVASTAAFRSISFVLTDMDETLTHHGRLAAATYDALERLQSAGIKVIPVTAAPAGWCDQMARMWPVDGVIAENGGLFLRRSADGQGVARTFWHPPPEQAAARARLRGIAEAVSAHLPEARIADDQDFRLTSLAFQRPGDRAAEETLRAALAEAGASATVNNLWVLGWVGAYDKLAMARRILSQVYHLEAGAHRDAVFYVGDSGNDAPMFAHFPHAAGVSTIREHLHDIFVPPSWITSGPGGAGFVEVADRILASR